MARNEIEVFEYLEARASVNGINIDDLQNLLSMPGAPKQYKHLETRIINAEQFILLFDKNLRKNVYLGCVNENYSIEEKDCYRIRRDLGTYTDRQDNESCVKCQLKCIQKVKNGELEIRRK